MSFAGDTCSVLTPIPVTWIQVYRVYDFRHSFVVERESGEGRLLTSWMVFSPKSFYLASLFRNMFKLTAPNLSTFLR